MMHRTKSSFYEMEIHFHIVKNNRQFLGGVLKCVDIALQI
jgi:hypothetical protein